MMRLADLTGGCLVAVIYCCLSLGGTEISVAQQIGSQEIQITSPGMGTVVNPGQPVQISVAAGMGATLTKVSIVSESPLSPSPVVDAPPFVFSIFPPAGARLGQYRLTAWALDGTGKTVVSTPVLIDLEPSSPPSSLSVNPPQLYFRSQGQMLPLRVTARFPDGSIADATESSNVAYASGNTGLAAVGSAGLVTAISPGATSITVSYGTASNLNITVPISIGGAGVSIAPTSLTFAAQQVGGASQPQTVTMTNQANGPITIRAVSATGNFTESDNCDSASPLAKGASCSANVVFAPMIPGILTGTLTVADSFDGISPSISLSGTATPAPNFSLSATPDSATLSSGGSASYTLTVMPSGGFNQTISLSCSGAPSGATCSISPASITLNGSTASNATVTVSANSAGLAGFTFGVAPGRYALWYALFLLTILCLLLVRRTRLAAAVLIAALTVACGNGSTARGSGVQPGTYTLTLQGTAGSNSQTTQVTLLVQ